MNRTVKLFSYEFKVFELLVLFFAYLMMENIFSWLVVPNSVLVLAFEKIASILIFIFVLFNFLNFKRNEQIYIGLFCFVMLRLVFESMFKYGTIFQQLTLFTVLFPVIYTFFIKAVCRSLNFDVLEFIANFYLVVYVLMMLVYGRGFSFSLASVEMDDYGPFSGDSRIIHARSIFMMIIPFLWYLAKFLNTKKIIHLGVVVFCFIVILIHQHRSVWASTIVASLLFLIMIVRNKILAIPRFVNLMILTLLIIVSAAVILQSVAPQFLSFMSDRFSEILDPTREGGTGEFREQQREVYFQYVLQRPFFGWTFEGFEMPNPLVDWWPAKSGQHFHEGYMEMLFYHGLFGLLLKYWCLVYLFFKAFSRQLDIKSIVLIAFSLAGLVFSFSYVLPLIFWGHVGLCLYYLENARNIQDRDEEEPETAIQVKEINQEMSINS